MNILRQNKDQLKEVALQILMETFPGEVCGELSYLASGSNNVAYYASISSQVVVIRITNVWRGVNVPREAWCYQKAASLGIPGPTVVATGVARGLPYIVLSYLEGIPGSQLPGSQQKVWHEVGRYGRLINSVEIGEATLTHDGTDIFESPCRKWLDHISAARAALTQDDSLLGCDTYSASQATILRQAFEKMQETPFRFGLCHADLDPTNTIVGSDGVIYLIDWCCASANICPHADLSSIFRYLDVDDPFLEDFLRGYKLERRELLRILPEIRTFTIADLFSQLRWAICDNREDLIPEYVSEARRAVDKNIALLHGWIGE